MMKFIQTIIILLISYSCSVPKERIPFDTIDYSCHYGITKSLKIYNNGQAYISNCYNYSNRIENFSLNVNKTQLDSLTKMIKVLSNVKLDSMFFALKCDHPISFALIIKSKERVILTSYNGDLNEKRFTPLFQLHEYLKHLINIATIKSDTVITFESKSRLILPPKGTTVI